VEIGHLSRGHYLAVQVPPGEYQLQSPGFKHPALVKAEAEKAYYVQFFATRFLVGGSMVIMEPLAGDDMAAFLGAQAELKVDLSKADPARLRDTAPLPREDSTGENASAP
jgi:hypothetical protein